MAKTWEMLRQELPTETRDSALSARFGFLIDEMHEANHRLKDSLNHDAGVTSAARRLDETFQNARRTQPAT